MRVALVERAEIGAGATAAAMGHIVVLDDSPAQLALTRYSQMLWRQLAGELPCDVEYTQRGTLWVAADDEEMQEICRKHSAYKEHGISSGLLDAQALAHTEPALRPGLAGGLLMPEDAVVSPQLAAKFLLSQALVAGATLIREQVFALGSGRALLTNGDKLQAPILDQRGRGVGLRPNARTPRGQAKGPSGDHGSVSRIFALPGRRTRLSEERSRHNH